MVVVVVVDWLIIQVVVIGIVADLMLIQINWTWIDLAVGGV